jgi:hypothetical protein
MGTSVGFVVPNGAPLPAGQYWCGVKSEHIEDVWPAIEDLVERLVANDDGGWTAQDVKEFCKRTDAGGGQLWLFGVPSRIDIVVVTCFEDLPQLKYMQLFGLVGDDLPKYYHYFHEVLVPFAKENGAVYVQTFCRKGLEKTLREWKKKFSVMRYYL